MSEEQFKHADLQPFAIGVFHEFSKLVLSEVMGRSAKAVSDLGSD